MPWKLLLVERQATTSPYAPAANPPPIAESGSTNTHVTGSAIASAFGKRPLRVSVAASPIRPMTMRRLETTATGGKRDGSSPRTSEIGVRAARTSRPPVAIRPGQDDLEVVGEAADGTAAIEEAFRLRPDVIVMDIRMPRLDGIEATRRIIAQGTPAPRILVLTTFDLDEYVWDALRAGAGGFLLKDAAPPQTAEAVGTVAAGESIVAPAVTRRLVERFVRTPLSGTSAQSAASPSSPNASSRSSYSSPADSPTGRSQPASSSPRRRSRRT